MEENKTFTQEELNTVLKERLEREHEKWQKKYADYLSPDDVKNQTEELTKQIASLSSQLDEANKKSEGDTTTITELQGKIKKFETDAIKVKVASEYGIPTELAGRLTGETEEDFKKDAEALKGFINSSTTMPLRNPEAYDKIDAKSQALRDMLGQLNV